MKSRISVAIVLFSSALLAACGGGLADPSIGGEEQDAPQTNQPTVSGNLTWGTTAASSTNYAYAVAVAQQMQSALPDVSVNVIETSGTPDNLQRMQGGSVQLVNLTSDVAGPAYAGTGAYAENPAEDLRVLWYFQLSPYHFIVRADSGVSTVSDLEDRSFNPGLSGSATEQTVLQALEVAGVSPAMAPGGLDDAVSAFKDRRIEGLVKAGPVPEPLMSELSISSEVSVVGFTDEQVAQIGDALPYLGFTSIPAGAYSGLIDDVQTLALTLGVGADKDVESDVVYELTKAMWENHDSISAAHATLEGVDIPSLTMDQANSPLHCGAVLYYEELGMSVPDELLPPEDC